MGNTIKKTAEKTVVKTVEETIDNDKKITNNNKPNNIGKTLFSMFYSEMDKTNQKASDAYLKDGEKGFIKHVFTDQNSGDNMSYSEMRSRYG